VGGCVVVVDVDVVVECDNALFSFLQCNVVQKITNNNKNAEHSVSRPKRMSVAMLNTPKKRQPKTRRESPHTQPHRAELPERREFERAKGNDFFLPCQDAMDRVIVYYYY
jgi:hypothetical protein